MARRHTARNSPKEREQQGHFFDYCIPRLLPRARNCAMVLIAFTQAALLSEDLPGCDRAQEKGRRRVFTGFELFFLRFPRRMQSGKPSRMKVCHLA